MKKQKLPKGWTEKGIRELAAHHDSQSEDDQAKEIEDADAAKDQAVMVVQTIVVPEIQSLIARKRGA